MVTASAFVLMDDNNGSAGETLEITSSNGEFTFMYDSNLNMDGSVSTKEVYLKSYNFSSDFVTIPNTITDLSETYYVTVIGVNAFYQKSNMNSVTIGDNVKLIKEAAFRECTSLKGVNLKNVTEVERQAFIHCTSLTELTANYLETIGDSAFAILDTINMNPYSGEIPTIEELSLPAVTKIGTGAFGYVQNNSKARDFGTVNLDDPNNPNKVVEIGNYAFSQSKITGTLSISSAKIIGDYAFHLANQSDTDTSLGYEIEIQETTKIGRNAFTGRAITAVGLPTSATYTIGENAFMYTKLQSATLGMVSSIGTGAFDGIYTLEFINVNATNTNYASLIGKDPTAKGDNGALYKLNGGTPETLIKLPPMIRPLLEERGFNFVVADGATKIEKTAFERCPSISVDLNGVTSIPSSAFTGSDIVRVSAKNVTSIGFSAFYRCTALESVEFLDTGAQLVIGQEAFASTSLVEISLPKDTKIGPGAFSNLNFTVEELAVWSDIEYEGTAESDAFSSTRVTWFRVISDASCALEAKAIYDGWNASGWSFGGSGKVELLIIDNDGAVDISGLEPTAASGMIQITNLGNINGGNLQFVEYKDNANPVAYHRISGKNGVYQAEEHGSAGSEIDIKTFDGTNDTGKKAYNGDGITWELVYEYYTIHFYTFSTTGDGDGDGDLDGDDPDYVNDSLISLDPSVRIDLHQEEYLASRELKSLMWQTFVRYGLDGWFIADNNIHASASIINKSHQIRANDIFESTIPDEWIWRDVNDEGHLNLYAVFIGKEYRIELEARVSGGQGSTAPSSPDSRGGTVELILDTPHNGSDGFDTDTDTDTLGNNSASYPFGTGVTLKATPKTGYAFIGWGVIDLNSGDPIFTERSDRSLVQTGGTAEWAFNIPTQMKYVAYFAKTIDVTFDLNDGTNTVTVKYIQGDSLIEASNDYNGFDYEFEVGSKTNETLNLGKGNEPYPYDTSDITKPGLTFGGWYRYGTNTAYASYDETDLENPGTSLKALVKLPALATITLQARWFATITFHPDDGTNDATLTGTGLSETSSGSGIYTYQHNVGTWSSTLSTYNGTFAYGTTYAPVAPNVNFNGWYVLSSGLLGVPSVNDIVTVSAGTNKTTPYKDIYKTMQRLEPGTVVSGHISLMALYTADVEFYFNDADGIDYAIDTPTPYLVTAPVSVATLMNDQLFDAINNGMQNADTTGNTYKEDTKGNRMGFAGWYVSVDGSTPPSMTDTPYGSTTQITRNVKLIAGWEVTVTFADRGTVGIIDRDTTLGWVPGLYSFKVLEGTVFYNNYPGMPDLELGIKVPSAWYDASTNPYTWYADGITKFTYSVELVPEFADLFRFNLMGGDQGVAQVPYSTADTFQNVLDRFLASLRDSSSGTYIELTKTGLYYESNSSTITPGSAPDAVWYKNDGGTGVPDYVNNSASLVKWNPTDTIGTDTVAYIRWFATVEFNVNVPGTDSDSGTSPNPPSIKNIDEGVTFSSLALPSVPTYNTAGDKSFRGWFNGLTQYTGSDGAPALGAPNITGSITLSAGWSVEVKFYYTGTPINPSIGTLGSDPNGTFLTVEVNSSGTVATPRFSKTNFTTGNFLWYLENATVPVKVNSLIASNTPECFDITQTITVNTTLYAKWYADVTLSLNNPVGGGLFNTPVHLLEGTKLSDLLGLGLELDPYVMDSTKDDWMFIGWYDQTGITDYDDLGIQYYRTAFDDIPDDMNTPSDLTSVAITKNVTLKCEYVVEVQFDSGYESGTAIDSQYLRVNKPIPDMHSDKFTPKPIRSGVTFMGWTNLLTNQKYTVDTRNSDAPNTRNVMGEMTLTALWLISVSFYDLEEYMQNGIQITTTSMITQVRGPDNTLNTNDDFFEMPEGTAIRQLIAADPSASGKTFVSWFVEQGTPDGLYGSGDTAYGLTDRITTDITLTAGYGYRIQYDTNGGTPSAIPETLVIEGQSLTLPESPAKGRLTFSGWNDGTDTLDAGDTVTPTVNKTYTAKWLVIFKLYDGISMTPAVSLEWDEEDGPDFEYATKRDSDYDVDYEMDYGGRVLSAKITYTTAGGSQEEMILEKFIDRYVGGDAQWVPYYSTFEGWIDPFTGATFSSTYDLTNLFGGTSDSTALFAVWKERVRYYDGENNIQTSYVDAGAFLGEVAPNSYSGWADAFNPTIPLKPDTYRIRDSMDFVATKQITVTFDANGGRPATQEFSNVVSGTMVGMIGATEPTRSGMYFAGWYADDRMYSFTDKLDNDITLKARWQNAPVERHTIFATAHNATISNPGMMSVIEGETVSFDFYADVGYTVRVLIDGQEIDSRGMSSYTFYNVSADHSIDIEAYHTDSSNATEFLEIHVIGNGDVLYSRDGGVSFTSYVSPLPLYDGVVYILKAAPGPSSFFEGWTGDRVDLNSQITISSDGTSSMHMDANFRTENFGGLFSTGQLSILNLIFVIIALIVGLLALTVSHVRNHDGTGTGKTMRFGALFLAVISLVLLFLTQGFGGSYVTSDMWTIPMAILMLATIALALLSVRYDHLKDD